MIDKYINIMKRLITLLVLPLLFTACEIFEPYDEIYYHNVGAEGYVYYQDKPVPNALICVSNYFQSKGLAVKGPLHEYFRSDTTGYFRVKFIKRTGHEDVKAYQFVIGNDTLQNNEEIALFPKEIRNSKTDIQLGKINLIRKIL